MQGRGRDPFTPAQVEPVAGRQRMEDDPADHQRPMAVDLPGVGLGARAIDHGDRAASDDLHDVVRLDDPGGVLVYAEAEQARVLRDQAEPPADAVPLLDMLVAAYTGHAPATGPDIHHTALR